jgi:hypothetical protein
MVTLESLFGGAAHHSFSSGLQLNIASPVIQRLNPSGADIAVVMPPEDDVLTLGLRFVLINDSAYDIWIEWHSTSFSAGYRNISAAGDTLTAGNNLNLFPPRQWVTISGFANSGNNGHFQVISRESGELVVDGAFTSETIALPPEDPLQVFVQLKKMAKLPAGSKAYVYLAKTDGGTRVWHAWIEELDLVKSVVRSEGHTSICIEDEVPPEPPDPYDVPDPPVDPEDPDPVYPPLGDKDCDDLPGPCRTSGTVTIGGEDLFEGAAGVYTVTWDGESQWASPVVGFYQATLFCTEVGWTVRLQVLLTPYPSYLFNNTTESRCPANGDYPVSGGGGLDITCTVAF